MSNNVPFEGVDVGGDGDMGPVALKDAAAVGVPLAVEDGGESCPMCSKAEASDTAEKIDMRHHHPYTASSSVPAPDGSAVPYRLFCWLVSIK
jgi:hypothetical protein